MDHVIGGKFKLGRKIGSGSFGELYLGMLPFDFLRHVVYKLGGKKFDYFGVLMAGFLIVQGLMCKLERKWLSNWYLLNIWSSYFFICWVDVGKSCIYIIIVSLNPEVLMVWY